MTALGCTCGRGKHHKYADCPLAVPGPPAPPEGPTADETLEVIVGALDNLYRDVRSNPDTVDQGYANAARSIRQSLTSGWLVRSPEGPDEGMREAEAAIRQVADNWPTPLGSDEVRELARFAVSPLLTAERERADALQRQVDAVRALIDEANGTGRAQWVYAADLRAALSRTATEGKDRG